MRGYKLAIELDAKTQDRLGSQPDGAWEEFERLPRQARNAKAI